MDENMKNSLLKPKVFISTTAFSLVVALGLAMISQSLNSSTLNLHKLNSGIGICFQRVTQTFTALMIKDFGSDFLNKEFGEKTSECFNQASTLVSSLNLENSVLKTINNLKSDLHWFHQKVARVNTMAQEGQVDLSQSNVNDKFYELETLKSSLEEEILSVTENKAQMKSLVGLAFILSATAFFLSLLAGGLYYRLESRKRRELEEKLHEAESVEKSVQIGLLALKELNLKNISDVFSQYVKQLTDENVRLEDSLLKLASESEQRYLINEEIKNEKNDDIDKILANTLGNGQHDLKQAQEETQISADFNLSLNLVLDRLQDMAFKNGIILDTDLSEEFQVLGHSETLQQMLYTLLNYSLDKASALENVEKKMSIRCKPLGGIAYCKVKIENYSFSDEEISVFNNTKVEGDASVNLLLIKELLNDMNASVALRVRQDSSRSSLASEFEIIFDRAKDIVQSSGAQTTSKRKLIKGNKEDIKRFFQSEA
ncbi:MAG: hypothetical protein CME66_11685 [Halobacteriovoraceae bacterium]|nr:hypothetical protein [Halobacteriovoraceae bacterium]